MEYRTPADVNPLLAFFFAGVGVRWGRVVIQTGFLCVIVLELFVDQAGLELTGLPLPAECWH